jgi:hypothetical protein
VTTYVPEFLKFIAESKLFHVSEWGGASDSKFPTPTIPVKSIADAELYSSEDLHGMHRIALDIDGKFCHVEPSSTPGNYHLVIDHKMSWEDYQRVLDILAEVGLIQPGYYAAAITRQGSHLRLPWVKKEA